MLLRHHAELVVPKHLQLCRVEQLFGLHLATNLNEFSLSSAMSSDKPFHVYANQIQGQVEQGNSASLLGES
jgi:hypothetical protein